MLVFEILPAAIGIAISPLPVMIVVLLLVAGNSRSAVAYVVGWALGILAVGVALVYLADLSISEPDPTKTLIAAWGSILLGFIFLIMALMYWRATRASARKRAEAALAPEDAPAVANPGRKHTMEDLVTASLQTKPVQPPADVAALPGWMRAVDKVPVLLAFLIAAVSAFNPKNLSMIMLAVTDINLAHVGPLHGSVAYINFVVLASLSVAVPVLYWIFDREGANRHLQQWQRWLALHQNQIMMWLFLVLGLLAVVKGSQKLF